MKCRKEDWVIYYLHAFLCDCNAFLYYIIQYTRTFIRFSRKNGKNERKISFILITKRFWIEKNSKHTTVVYKKKTLLYTGCYYIGNMKSILVDYRKNERIDSKWKIYVNRSISDNWQRSLWNFEKNRFFENIFVKNDVTFMRLVIPCLYQVITWLLLIVS